MKESKISRKEKVSGTFAILGHAFYFAITMPLFVLVLSVFCYALVHDFKLDMFFIVAFFAGIFYLITRISLAYSDVYIEGNTIVLQKLWGSKRKPISEYKIIESAAILPYTYIIEFEDGRRDYFWLKAIKVLQHTFSNDPDKILKELRLKFRNLKETSL